jgi:hypothetical protein
MLGSHIESSGPGKTTPRDYPQGMTNIKAVIDHTAVEMCRRYSDNALFPHAEAEDAFNTYRGQLAFTINNIPRTGGDGRVPILTSLNGAGSDSVARFPNDEDLAVLDLESNITVVGTMLTETVYKEDSSQITGVTVQVGGVRNAMSYVPIPFGVKLKGAVHKPSWIKNNGGVPSIPGTNGNQFVLGVLPWDPSTCSEKLFIAMRAVTRDKAGFKRNPITMGRKQSEMRKLNSACRTIVQADIFQAFMMIDVLIKKGVIRPIRFTDEYDLTGGRGGVSQTSILLGMMKAMGVIPSETPDLPDITIDAAARNKYANITSDIAMHMYPDPRVANTMFGFDSATKTNPAIDPTTGVLRKSTAIGAVVMAQQFLPKAKIFAFAEFVEDDRRNIIGTSLRGAKPGDMFTFV